MKLPGFALAFAILLGLSTGAFAQVDKYEKPVDLKPLILPAFPLPPSSQINPGSVGGSQQPYTTAPLQNPSGPGTQSAPGFRLTIPSR
jgi:hypothetical protein